MTDWDELFRILRECSCPVTAVARVEHEGKVITVLHPADPRGPLEERPKVLTITPGDSRLWTRLHTYADAFEWAAGSLARPPYPKTVRVLCGLGHVVYEGSVTGAPDAS